MLKKILIGIAGIVFVIVGVSGGKALQEKVAEQNNQERQEEAINRLIARFTPENGGDGRVSIVTYVIDGDTFKIEDGARVRLIGVDAPEKGECYYEESRDFLVTLLTEKEVRLQKDISGKDSYDRLLRYVVLPSEDSTVDDIFVNRLLLEEGYARILSISPDVHYRDLFATAENNALREKKGLWGACD